MMTTFFFANSKNAYRNKFLQNIRPLLEYIHIQKYKVCPVLPLKLLSLC